MVLRLFGKMRPLTGPFIPVATRVLDRHPGWRPRDLQLLESSPAWSPEEWWITQWIFGMLVGLAGMMVFESAFWGMAMGVGCGYLPNLWVKEQLAERQRRLLRGLPNILDLLTACVEGGMTFDAAVGKIVEFGVPSKLRDEFAQYLYEVNVGKPRREAMKAMAGRVQLKEFSTFTSGVSQAEQLGTSLAEGLKIQAQEIRVKWRQHMERQALEAPVKLLLPLTLFIFPTTFIVIFGPFLIQMMNNF